MEVIRLGLINDRSSPTIILGLSSINILAPQSARDEGKVNQNLASENKQLARWCRQVVSICKRFALGNSARYVGDHFRLRKLNDHRDEGAGACAKLLALHAEKQSEWRRNAF